MRQKKSKETYTKENNSSNFSLDGNSLDGNSMGRQVDELPEDVRHKYVALKELLLNMGSVAIGFSGGVDSTLLLKVAHDTLGEKALGVIGKSATYPGREYEEALGLAEHIGARVVTIDTHETDLLKFQENPPDRCYYCKNELFSKIRIIAQQENIAHIADGSNSDDGGDFRPGMAAVKENGVRSPLSEADLNKNDIRLLSRVLGLPTWNKQSFACLSSRFPYGQSIEKEKLTKIEKAETFLRDHGFSYFRARHHDEQTVRVEVGEEEIKRFGDDHLRRALADHMRALGFVYVTLDLQGFRSGSMNEVLNDDEKREYLRNG